MGRKCFKRAHGKWSVEERRAAAGADGDCHAWHSGCGAGRGPERTLQLAGLIYGVWMRRRSGSRAGSGLWSGENLRVKQALATKVLGSGAGRRPKVTANAN